VLAKPCNPQELIATLHSIFRRSKTKTITRPIIQRHSIEVNITTREATVHGVHLDLTNAEFHILEMFIKSPGQAFSKQELTELALRRPFTAYDRSIDVHISNLRSKLGDIDATEPLIKTIRGFGYMLRP
jgi:two-component system response regulator CpxR